MAMHRDEIRAQIENALEALLPQTTTQQQRCNLLAIKLLANILHQQATKRYFPSVVQEAPFREERWR